MIDENKLLHDIVCDLECYRDIEGKPLGSIYANVQDVINAIKGQPQVNVWIPITERLPEEHRMFNITYRAAAGNRSDSAFYNPELNVWFWDDDETMMVQKEVLAWQPIPEAYQEN